MENQRHRDLCQQKSEEPENETKMEKKEPHGSIYLPDIYNVDIWTTW